MAKSKKKATKKNSPTSAALTSIIPKVLMLFVAAVVLVSAYYLLGVSVGRMDKKQFLQKKQESLHTAKSSAVLIVRGQAVIEDESLRITSPQIEWFSERPERLTGAIAPTSFIKAWEGWKFDINPPNAAISGSDAIIELEGASYTETGLMQFDYIVLSGTLSDGDKGTVTLFIDAIPTPVNGQITDVQESGYNYTCNAQQNIGGAIIQVSSTVADANCDDWNSIASGVYTNAQNSGLDSFSYTLQPGLDAFDPEYDCSGNRAGFGVYVSECVTEGSSFHLSIN